MYKHILIPVDLAHPENLAKAIGLSADLGQHFEAKTTMVSVTTSAPSAIAKNPEEFSAALSKFAADKGDAHGVTFATKAVVSPDPTIDLDHMLSKTASELGCDLIIMASHVPGFAEYVFGSQGGHLAAHSELSVFVVR